jgi:hypothetical protein
VCGGEGGGGDTLVIRNKDYDSIDRSFRVQNIGRCALIAILLLFV